jgi:hypothetical protein
LSITEDYLGPAAPRFVERMVANHLDKPADKISDKDLPELVLWIKLAVTVITEDEKVVQDYLERLESLAGAHRNGSQRLKSSKHTR